MFYDIVIVGAGPCGLAAAARLREKTPTALFTNDEHARFWKLHRQHRNSLEQEQKRKSSVDSGYSSDADGVQFKPHQDLSIIVLDANSNEWMSTWKQRFGDLRITHLRSPLFFHPDPSDKDGLLAYAYERGRADELLEIPDVAGKEVSKHQRKKNHGRKKSKITVPHLRLDGRDQIDYYTPSTSLFEDYCDQIIDRYSLRELVRTATISDLSYEHDPPNLHHGLFTIRTSQLDVYYSRVVIVATGPSVRPTLPDPMRISLPTQDRGVRHVFDQGGTELPPELHHGLVTTSALVNIVVVGGGLTSAQLIDLLFTRYPSCGSKRHNIHIHLVLRHSRLKCKPFDVDLPWVSKTRNHLMSTFWSAKSDVERMKMFQKARNGGSMPTQFARVLKRYQDESRLSIHYSSQLNLDHNCVWDTQQKKWTTLTLKATPTIGPIDSIASQVSSQLPDIDHIIFCTGISSPKNSFSDIPFLQSLHKAEPIDTIGPLPILTDDLAWSSTIPCFFTGALAALRLGPGAGNLGGGRLGAERIAWAVEEIFEDRWYSQKVGGGSEEVNRKKDTNKQGMRESPKRGKKVSKLHWADDDNPEPAKVYAKRVEASKRSYFTGSSNNQFAALATEG